jgi:hypothetical protein
MGTRNSIPVGIYSIRPLGYVYTLNVSPIGLLLGKNLHPMGKRVLERSTLTHTRYPWV